MRSRTADVTGALNLVYAWLVLSHLANPSSAGG
jgi:hypothetical protein